MPVPRPRPATGPARRRRAGRTRRSRDRASLVEACRDREVVFHFAAHYPSLSLDHNATLATGLRQLENVLDSCAKAGVKRLVFVSSVATVRRTNGLSSEEHAFPEAPGFGVYHDLKWHLERRILDESRFETSILCPGACLGPFDMRLGTSAMLVATARGERVPHADGWVNVSDARDVAEIAWRVALLDRMPSRLLVSASNHRLHDLLRQLAARYGAPRPDEPLTPNDAVALADREERQAAREGSRAAVSRELVDLTIHGSPIDASRAEQLCRHRYRSLDDTLDAFDEWARSRNIIPKAQPTLRMEAP